MRLKYIFPIWTLWQPILVLATQQHDAQRPIQLGQLQAVQPAFDHVILAFTENNNAKISRAEVPLGVQIPSGVSLPMNPSTLRIETAVNKYGKAKDIAELDHVMCRAIPMLDSKEKAAWDMSGARRTWPWFGVQDGTVFLERATSRWFLAGQAIASYECR